MQQLTSSRCAYTNARSQRCRMAASPGSPYCHSHAKNTVIVASTLASELSQAAGALSAPEDVNRVLAKIFLALAEDRLSTRKAAVLGYIGQMLLRSHREIAFHKKLADDEAKRNDSGPHVVIDIPGMTLDVETSAVTPPQPQAVPTGSATTPVAEIAPSTNEPNATDESSQPYPPLADLNHFYPNDPSLQPTLQRASAIPPDAEELRWRELSRRYAPSRRRR